MRPRPRWSSRQTPRKLVPGACAVLSWIVSDAIQVTLDGTPVISQDQRSICPAGTQSFVLVASNSAGQVVRELTVRVIENAPAQAPIQPGSTATRTPTGGAGATPPATPRLGATLVSTATPGLPIATVAVVPATGAQPPAATSEPSRPGLAGIAVAHAQELAPAATPILPVSHGLASESQSLLVAPATPTPRPRRQLGADGRPTPTPILLAYAQPAGSSGVAFGRPTTEPRRRLCVERF